MSLLAAMSCLPAANQATENAVATAAWMCAKLAEADEFVGRGDVLDAVAMEALLRQGPVGHRHRRRLRRYGPV